MKKIMLLCCVFLFVVCSAQVFAQQIPWTPNFVDAKSKVTGTYANFMILKQSGRGGPNPVLIADTGGTIWVPISGSSDFSKKIKKIRTSEGQYIEFIMWDGTTDAPWKDPWWTKRVAHYQIQPNQEIVFNGDDIGSTRSYSFFATNQFVDVCSLKWDANVPRRGETLEFISKVTFAMKDEKTILDKVNETKKSSKTTEELVETLIDKAISKAGWFGALVGANGFFAIPFAQLASQKEHMLKAELAYAIALAYGITPTQLQEFKGIDDLGHSLPQFSIDLLYLFSDRTFWLTDTAEGLPLDMLIEAAFNGAEKLCTALGFTRAAGAMTFANTAFGGVLGGWNSIENAKVFAKKAKVYYQNKAKIIAGARVQNVKLDKPSSTGTIRVNTTLQLKATVSPSNAKDKTVTWKSSDTSLATVDSSGLVTIKNPNLKDSFWVHITVTTRDGGYKDTCTLGVKAPVKVTGVKLSSSSGTLDVGKTSQLTATVSPNNADDKTVIWATSNANIATVSGTGHVAAKGAGKATITATTKDGQKQATFAVTVPAPVNNTAAYQKTIQAKCNYGNSTDVWNAINKLPSAKADNVYKRWAESYSKSYSAARPSNQTEKQIIQARCGFNAADANMLWQVIEKYHGYPAALIKTWAGSYYPNAPAPPSIKVAGVTLDSKSGTVDIGKTKQLKATVAPSNATDKTVTWGTSNANIAAVNGSGLVTAKAAGTATITVTTRDGQKKATSTVTVPVPVKAPPTAPPKAQTAPKPDVAKYQATIQAKCNYHTPADVWKAIDKHAYADDVYKKWTESYSKNYSKTRPNNQTDKQIIQARCGFGDANAVWSAIEKNHGYPAALLKTWADSYYPTAVVKVTGVSLNSTSGTLEIGKTKQLTATVAPSNATDKTVTWSTSNANVAAVSASGLVTAKAAGTATITATTRDGQKKAASTVTVPAKTSPPPVVKVTGVSLDSSSVTVGIGATRQLTATVSPSNAADRAVTWTSGNANIANVSTSGLVTARSAGTATITVTTKDGGYKATCAVTVPPPAPVAPGPAPLTWAACRSIIQARAQYHEAEQAWRVIESLSIADTVYQKWAKSNLSMHRTFPSNKDNDAGYKSIIQSECGFTSAEINAIWSAIEKIHTDGKSFKKVWARCYYDR